MLAGLRYVLVTPARNEEDFLELTIRSVVEQSARPLRWVIVSDGSTDRTDEMVLAYAARHPWIELVRMPARPERHFGGKVACFNAGYEKVRALDFDVIGSLDADLSFDEGYFAFLLGHLAENPRLGLTGTPFVENGITYDFRYSSVEHVSGACQLFRRECYESIGGYVSVKGGGIDTIAVLSARMQGWETRTWLEKTCLHHRPMGAGMSKSAVAARFKLGQTHYREGFHPLWLTLRSIFQAGRKPYVLGGMAIFCGYFWAWVRRFDQPMGPALVAFQRCDQMRRLRALIFRSAGLTRPPTPSSV